MLLRRHEGTKRLNLLFGFWAKSTVQIRTDDVRCVENQLAVCMSDIRRLSPVCSYITERTGK